MDPKAAVKAILRDAEEAFLEPGHPGFHLTAPAHFTLDFWGALKKDGLYHILCHVSPGRDGSLGETVFFHAVSRDLVRWEWLPVPIAPGEDELRMNDGCIAFDREGKPVMLYTAVFRDPAIPRVHRAAFGAEDLSAFVRRDEPFMTLENHGGPAFGGGWSDPFVFRTEGRTFLLMSKCVTPDGQSPLPIYEAKDGTLLNWNYRGILFDRSGEVVSFFPLRGKWVLLFSPYAATEYYVGDFDTETLSFRPIRHGILSHGYHRQDAPTDRGLYAACVWQEEEKRILSGWIGGIPGARLWDGIMAFPRELDLDDRLCLTQKPIGAISSLIRSSEEGSPGENGVRLRAEEGMFLLSIRLSGENGSFSLQVGEKEGEGLRLRLSRDSLFVNGDTYPLTRPGEKDLILLYDRTAAEILVGNGTTAATAVFPLPEEATVSWNAADGYAVGHYVFSLLDRARPGWGSMED